MRIKAAVLASDGAPIEVSTGGLLDPSRFTKRREAQTDFENRIASEFGYPQRRKMAARATFDWRTIDTIRETRFFDGDPPSHYGRRIVLPTFGDE
jgi:hypothetical protein